MRVSEKGESPVYILNSALLRRLKFGTHEAWSLGLVFRAWVRDLRISGYGLWVRVWRMGPFKGLWLYKGYCKGLGFTVPEKSRSVIDAKTLF